MAHGTEESDAGTVADAAVDASGDGSNDEALEAQATPEVGAAADAPPEVTPPEVMPAGAEPAALEASVDGAQPDAGTAPAEARRACLNCGAEVTGKYCAACGQAAHLHRTFLSLGHDVLHSVFHFEGKFWRTMPELAFFPGRLTRRYIHGERAKFVSPMALFLFTVFLTYAVFGLVGGGDAADTTPGAAALAATRERLADLREDLDDANLSAARRAEIAQEIAQLEAQQGPLEAAAREAAAAPKIFEFREANRSALDYTRRELERLEQQLEETSLPPERREAITRQMATLESERTVLDALVRGDWELLEGLDERAAEVREAELAGRAPLEDNAFVRGMEELRENPTLMWYKLKTNAYKYSWLLVPLSIPFVWLLFFWRRDIHLYDHAVFVTYSISFVLMLLIASVLAQTAGMSATLGGQLFLVAVVAHMYRQLRGAYLLSVPGAVVRLVLMLLAAMVVLSIFSSVLFVLGAL